MWFLKMNLFSDNGFLCGFNNLLNLWPQFGHLDHGDNTLQAI